MRRFVLTAVAAGLLAASAGPAAAQDRPQEPAWRLYWNRIRWDLHAPPAGFAEQAGSDRARVVETLEAALTAPAGSVRIAAGWGLARLGARSGTELRQSLQHLGVAGYAFCEEARRGTNQGPIHVQLFHDRAQDTGLRAAAGLATGLSLGDSAVVPLLQVLARADDRLVHLAAVQALGMPRTPAAASRLVAICKSRRTHNSLRAASIHAWPHEKVGRTDTIGLARTLALTDRSDVVRRAACWWLRQEYSQRGNDTLERVVRNDGGPTVRAVAAMALGRMLATVSPDVAGSDGWRANGRLLLHQVAASGAPEASAGAAAGLGLLGQSDPEAVALLRSLYTTELPTDARRAVVVALTACGSGEDLAVLRSAADRPEITAQDRVDIVLGLLRVGAPAEETAVAAQWAAASHAETYAPQRFAIPRHGDPMPPPPPTRGHPEPHHCRDLARALARIEPFWSRGAMSAWIRPKFARSMAVPTLLALGYRRDADAIDALIGVATDHHEPAIRATALRALAILADPRTGDPIARALHRSDPLELQRQWPAIRRLLQDRFPG